MEMVDGDAGSEDELLLEFTHAALTVSTTTPGMSLVSSLVAFDLSVPAPRSPVSMEQL